MARILIVDDDDDVRDMLRQILERSAYEVLDASNGNHALEMQRQSPADLIITDIIMPEKEGIETIVALKREFPEVKIVAMSGGGRGAPEDYLLMAKGIGAARTFFKPIGKEELLTTVRELLG